jgi:hypothetical protein
MLSVDDAIQNSHIIVLATSPQAMPPIKIEGIYLGQDAIVNNIFMKLPV